MDPTSADDLLSRAVALEAAGDARSAGAIVNRLLHDGHCVAPVVLLFGKMSRELRQESDALEAILRVLADSFPRPPRMTSSLHFMAADLLDRLGRYDEAFEHAVRANAPRAGSYDRAGFERLVNTCIQTFTRATMRRLARAANHDPTPVFIVGMPRSGTTLVEQILASHPQAFGGGELQWVSGLWVKVAQRLGVSNASLTACMERISSADADAVAKDYLAALKGLRPGAERIVDKTLSNFMHLGLISVLFPGGRVIHCRRDPLDTCLSCYMIDFEDVLPFTCDLGSIGHFHRHETRLMEHWKHVLDLPRLEVDYEKVATDLEGQTRRLLEFVGLPWDERCLRFHENRREVKTASHAQVRRPIYTSSIGRWRHYDKWLSPARAALKG